MLFSHLELWLAMSSVVLAAPDFGILDESRKYWPGNSKPQNLDALSLHLDPGYEVLAIRKMSHQDEGEKFRDEDWELQKRSVVEVRQLVKRTADLRAPAKAFVGEELSTPEGILKLFKRQGGNRFTCPTGTRSCASIQRIGSCCRLDEVCKLIEDTGAGDVACCPSGYTCTGTLDNCGDKKTCSRNEGGGCCIDGYKCSLNGCIPDGTNLQLTPTTTLADPTEAAGAGGVNGEQCSEGFYQCPPSVGGGCCRNGRACGVSDCPASGGPVETNIPTQSGGNCPTGYYTCAPQFNGGCCRVGRDCGINTCPPRDGADPTDTRGGVTPTDTAVRCPNGWYGCDAAFGGGCCPNGYNCGANNCPAQNPNNAAATKVQGSAAPKTPGSCVVALVLFIASAAVLL